MAKYRTGLLSGMSRAKWLLALLFVAMAAVSVRAAIVVISVAAERAAPPAAPRGFEASDHFPGAALLYETMAQPAPASGSTGTAPLPKLPVPEDYRASPGVEDTIHPAAPFSMGGAAAGDYGRALNCLATAIYYEAASEPDAGQRAVAQVILNRVRHPAFPATICGVVYQGSERAGCQFSFACDGAMARAPSRTGWARALHNAGLMLAGTVEAQVGTATHYHTYAVTPAWNRAMVMTAVIGAHFFHRWKGYWGTPASLSKTYRGGEPLPGPHPRAAQPPGATLFAEVPIPPAPAPALAPATASPVPSPDAMIQPAHAQTSIATAEPSPGGTSLPDSQILDKWKDSGKPLR